VCVFDPASAVTSAVASFSAHAGPVYEVAVSGSDNNTVIRFCIFFERRRALDVTACTAWAETACCARGTRARSSAAPKRWRTPARLRAAPARQRVRSVTLHRCCAVIGTNTTLSVSQQALLIAGATSSCRSRWCRERDALARSIRIWDLRMLAKAPVQVQHCGSCPRNKRQRRLQQPAKPSAPHHLTPIARWQLLGHGYGVKRLRWSAHAAHHLLSCSYDTSVALRSPAALQQDDACAAGAAVGAGRRRRGRTQLLAAPHRVCHGYRLGFVRARPRGQLRLGQQMRVVGCWSVTQGTVCKLRSDFTQSKHAARGNRGCKAMKETNAADSSWPIKNRQRYAACCRKDSAGTAHRQRQRAGRNVQ
jgi:hypothetical protein